MNSLQDVPNLFRRRSSGNSTRFCGSYTIIYGINCLVVTIRTVFLTIGPLGLSFNNGFSLSHYSGSGITLFYAVPNIIIYLSSKNNHPDFPKSIIASIKQWGLRGWRAFPIECHKGNLMNRLQNKLLQPILIPRESRGCIYALTQAKVPDQILLWIRIQLINLED